MAIGVALLALRGGSGGRQWPIWVLVLPLSAALIRGAIQRHQDGAGDLARADGGGRDRLHHLDFRHPAAGRPPQRRGDLLHAALGLGSITLVVPLVALFPLLAVVLSLVLLLAR